jgi:hypothetical protein
MTNLKIRLAQFILQVVASEKKEKTIEEKMEEQDRPTVPTHKSHDEWNFYEELLKLLESEKPKSK